MYKIRTEAKFASAHCLPDHPGKCKNLHGHTYRVIVEVEVNRIDADTGMALDFYNFKKIVRHYAEKFDHKYINEDVDHPLCVGGCFFPPTAEHIACYLHGHIAIEINAALKPGTDYCVEVIVEESPGNQVTYSDGQTRTSGRLRPRNPVAEYQAPKKEEE